VDIFIGSAASHLGQTMDLSAFAQGGATANGKRLLVLKETDCYLGLLLVERIRLPSLLAQPIRYANKQPHNPIC
jgi:hypothetical protein